MFFLFLFFYFIPLYGGLKLKQRRKKCNLCLFFARKIAKNQGKLQKKKIGSARPMQYVSSCFVLPFWLAIFLEKKAQSFSIGTCLTYLSHRFFLFYSNFFSFISKWGFRPTLYSIIFHIVCSIEEAWTNTIHSEFTTILTPTYMCKTNIDLLWYRF